MSGASSSSVKWLPAVTIESFVPMGVCESVTIEPFVPMEVSSPCIPDPNPAVLTPVHLRGFLSASIKGVTVVRLWEDDPSSYPKRYAPLPAPRALDERPSRPEGDDVSFAPGSTLMSQLVGYDPSGIIARSAR